MNKHKIDWSKAPAWANYLCYDRDGVWFWYEDEPAIYRGDWFVMTGRFQRCDDLEPVNWKDSLIERGEVG